MGRGRGRGRRGQQLLLSAKGILFSPSEIRRAPNQNDKSIATRTGTEPESIDPEEVLLNEENEALAAANQGWLRIPGSAIQVDEIELNTVVQSLNDERVFSSSIATVDKPDQLFNSHNVEESHSDMDDDDNNDTNQDQEYIPTIEIDNSESSSDNEEEVTNVTDDTFETPAPKKAKKNVGRKQDPIWEEFTGTRDEPVCKYCHAKVSAKSTRLKKHLEKCSAKSALSRLSKNCISTKPMSMVGSGEVSQRPVVALRHGPGGKVATGRLPYTMLNYVEVMTQKEKEDLDLELGRMIFECNLPFHIVEHPSFKSFMKKLKPAYTLPCYATVGGNILKKIYHETTTQMKAELDGKSVTILQDGWSTMQNLPVISHCISSGTKTFVLDAVETGTASKTADYCLELLNKARQKASEELNCIPIACVTDNCSTMEAMRSRISDMHVYGCHSHLLNLLGQKLTPSGLQDKIKSVHTFYRNHHFEGAALKILNANRPVLPASTRWNSQIDTFRSYLQNRLKFIEISEMPGSNVSEDVKSTLEDRNILSKVKEILKVLEPIAYALDRLQREKSTIADGVSEWLGVEAAVKDYLSESTERLDHFKKYFNMALTDVAIAAYMLHPGYRGKGLDPIFQERGRCWLTKKNSYFVVAAVALELGDTNFFPESMLNVQTSAHMESINWWKAVSKWPGVTHELVNVALELMILPATTAGIERVFSVVSNILTRKRNRLGVTKAFQLCVIYITAAMKHGQMFSIDDFE